MCFELKVWSIRGGEGQMQHNSRATCKKAQWLKPHNVYFVVNGSIFYFVCNVKCELPHPTMNISFYLSFEGIIYIAGEYKSNVQCAFKHSFICKWSLFIFSAFPLT